MRSRIDAAIACASSNTQSAPLAPPMRPAVRIRLHRALSVVYGIEAYVILRDIWGLGDREIERIALWMADALVDAALRESAQRPMDRPHPRKGSKALAVMAESF